MRTASPARSTRMCRRDSTATEGRIRCRYCRRPYVVAHRKVTPEELRAYAAALPSGIRGRSGTRTDGMIDPHVHLRDWNQAGKETLRHGLSVAFRAGLDAVFEMPNTDPPLVTRDAIRRRIDDADAACRSLGIRIFHGLYAGLTAVAAADRGGSARMEGAVPPGGRAEDVSPATPRDRWESST